VIVAARVVPGRGAFVDSVLVRTDGATLGKTAFLVGLAQGAPLAAARVEAAACAAFRCLVPRVPPGEPLLLALGTALQGELEGRTLSATVLHVDYATGAVGVTGAGLVPIVRRRSTGAVEPIGTAGEPLGLSAPSSAGASSRLASWESGDLMLVVTPAAQGGVVAGWVQTARTGELGAMLERLLAEIPAVAGVLALERAS
jgi:hypothetical protein